MERIIAEFGIKTDGLLKGAQDAKAELDNLVAAQKKLTKSGDTSSRAFVENAAQIKSLRSEYNTYTKNLSSVVTATGSNTKAQRTLNNELDKSAKSINGARESNKALLKIRNQLNLKTAEGIKANEAINGKIDENNKFIKENVSELEKQKINVGNYSGALTDAIDKSGLFGGALRGIIGDLRGIIVPLNQAVLSTFGLSKAQNAATAATGTGVKALRLFKIALISTGIGAIVVAIGSLIAAFASTQVGADLISKALAPVQGAFEGIIGVVQEIALNFDEVINVYFGQFKDNFTILVNSFLIGSDRMRLAWLGIFGDDAEIEEAQNRVNMRQEELNGAIERTKERYDLVVDAIGKASDKIASAAAAQIQIVQKTIELEEAQIRNITANAEYSRQIKEQNKLAEDITKPIAIREAAAVRSVELAKEKLSLQQTELEQELDIALLEASKNDTNRETQKEIAQIRAKILDAETSSLELQTTQTNKVNQIRQQGISAAKKAQQDAIKAQEAAFKLFQLQSEDENASLNEKIKLIDDVLKKELEIIDAKQKAGLSQDEADLLRLQARNKALDENTQLTIDNAKQELDLYLLQNDAILNNDAELNQSLLDQKAAFYDERARLQIEALEAEGLSEDEFNARRAIIESENLKLRAEDKKTLEQTIKEENIAQEEVDFENKIIRLQEQDATQQEINAELRERDRELEVQKINETELSESDKAIRIKRVNDNARAADLKAEQILKAQKVALLGQTFGEISQLLGQNTKAGKAAGIAQAIINTYQGVTAELATKAITPFDIGLKIANVATVLGTGLAAVSKIRSTKAARGISFQGTLQGNSHANGGIDLGNGIEAEGGENMYSDGANTFVMNKKASALINRNGILGALSRINQSVGGGVPLTTPSSYLNSGGLVTSNLQSPSSINRSNRDIVDGISDNIAEIRVINIAEDTINIAEESIIVENQANL